MGFGRAWEGMGRTVGFRIILEPEAVEVQCIDKLCFESIFMLL